MTQITHACTVAARHPPAACCFLVILTCLRACTAARARNGRFSPFANQIVHATHPTRRPPPPHPARTPPTWQPRRHMAAHSDTAAHLAGADADASRLALVRAALALVPDFPRPGLSAYSIEALVASPPAFAAAIHLLAARYEGAGLTHVVGSEARGFLVAAPLALALRLPLVPVRRAQKLPCDDVVSAAIRSRALYASHGAVLEMQRGLIGPGSAALAVDDVIGSGATAEAVAELIAACGGRLVEAAALAATPGLHGCEHLAARGIATFTLLGGAVAKGGEAAGVAAGAAPSAAAAASASAPTQA
jgi:adenine phosphoribosyltransferase